MSKTTAVSSAHAELLSAQAADDEATRQAMLQGLIATKPLTLARLTELCALGEAMARTALRKQAALAAVISAGTASLSCERYR